MLPRTRVCLVIQTMLAILSLGLVSTWPAAAAGTRSFSGSVSVPEGVFSPGSSMHVARAYHTATLLPNGKVLVAGGADTRAEIYDPATDSWSPTGNMVGQGDRSTATLLPNGKVLVVSGIYAEQYDPAAGTWSLTGSMSVAHNYHTATLLSNGKVLVAGGGFPALSSAELYDPATGTWSPTGSMGIGRASHVATLLPNGKVLVAGGGAIASAELYDPATGTWSPTGSMATSRDYTFSAILLPNGKVLIAGGGFPALSSAELYDPATGTWSPTGSMAFGHYEHTTTLLPNGKVLVVEGFNAPNTELYDPATGIWRTLRTTSYNRPGGWGRSGHTATLLGNGSVLIAGGSYNDQSAHSDLASTELITVLPANTFAATLTLPAGWVKSSTISASFQATTTAAALDAGALSNDGSSWSAWLAASARETVTTTWDMGGEGADQPLILRLRDTNGQVASVVTGTVSIDLTAPTSALAPLPAASLHMITLSWSGADTVSGVASYDLQVRTGYGPWVDLLTNTVATSATYTGTVGTTYAFRVRARDVAGNLEEWPARADASTRVNAAIVYVPVIAW